MAVYETAQNGLKVISSGIPGECRCGDPAETEAQTGWIPEANYGAGGGQYEEICWNCRDWDNSSQWRNLVPNLIPEIAFQLVQNRRPVEVRCRDFPDGDWSNEQLVGFWLNPDEEGIVYFVDANGRNWLYCQIWLQQAKS